MRFQGLSVSGAPTSQHPWLAILGFGTMGQAISASLVEASGYPAGLIHAVDLHPAAGKRERGPGHPAVPGEAEAAARGRGRAALREAQGAEGPAGWPDGGRGPGAPAPVVSIAAGTTLAFLADHARGHAWSGPCPTRLRHPQGA
ncbi:MAG: hypothetical protein IPN91_08195 [Holophagaceae bacterium]|uniref:Uncharacterized protein n=1 Tax=Candidatus Geothrix odensensis TaxID=2954440 RepID=A0A936K686_9BACT|nr:hypothetical protein [Candidatus Geothrix odensensis]